MKTVRIPSHKSAVKLELLTPSVNAKPTMAPATTKHKSLPNEQTASISEVVMSCIRIHLETRLRSWLGTH